MQYTSYTPVFYPSRDLNVDASGFSWQLLNGGERSYSISIPQHAMDRYLRYDDEIVRKIIQNHEATFRYQVQELHQLYRRQQEVMDEMRMKEIFMQHLQLQTSKTNNQEHRNIGHEKRTLDLEYDDQREQFKEEFFSEGRPNFMIDLNAPAPMQLEEAKQESGVSLMAIDLNSLPLSCLSETASEIQILPLKNEDHAMRKEKCVEQNSAVDSRIDDNFLTVKTCIDLNTDVITDEHELSSNIVGIKSGAEATLEAPVSPENKEGPPPRGKSEDIQLEPTMELDGIAANTLIMISCARTESLQSFSSCLCWFAGIVSSTGDDLDKLVGGNCNDSSIGIDDFVEDHVIKNDKEKDIQTRKRKNACRKARRCSKLSPSDRKKSRSSICSILHGWGQVRKREGGRKRPATKKYVVVC